MSEMKATTETRPGAGVNLLGLALALWISACATGAVGGAESSVATESGRLESAAEAAAWYHGPTRMRFPETVAGFSRDADDEPDPGSDEVAVSYQRFDEEMAVLVTVHVYPRASRGSLEDNFRAATLAVLTQIEGAELIGQGAMALPQEGVVHEGRRAHFFVSNAEDPIPPQITHLFLFSHGPYFIKYRTIFLAFQHEAADRANLAFMEALPWPNAAKGRLAAWQPNPP